jgi:hypothetical protein
MKSENENIEVVLLEALRREPAPPDFAAKVLAKTVGPVANPQVDRKVIRMEPRPWVRRPLTLALAAGVAAMAIVPAAVLDYRRREEMKGLRAKRDLLTALAITRDQLQQVRAKVQRNVRFVQ